MRALFGDVSEDVRVVLPKMLAQILQPLHLERLPVVDELVKLTLQVFSEFGDAFRVCVHGRFGVTTPPPLLYFVC